MFAFLEYSPRLIFLFFFFPSKMSGSSQVCKYLYFILSLGGLPVQNNFTPTFGGITQLTSVVVRGLSALCRETSPQWFVLETSLSPCSESAGGYIVELVFQNHLAQDLVGLSALSVSNIRFFSPVLFLASLSGFSEMDLGPD